MWVAASAAGLVLFPKLWRVPSQGVAEGEDVEAGLVDKSPVVEGDVVSSLEEVTGEFGQSAE